MTEKAPAQIEKIQMSDNGRIVIPASFRKAMGLKPGETLTARMDGNGIYIQSRRQALDRLRALVRKHVGEGRSLADELIAERRQEAARE